MSGVVIILRLAIELLVAWPSIEAIVRSALLCDEYFFCTQNIIGNVVVDQIATLDFAASVFVFSAPHAIWNLKQAESLLTHALSHSRCIEVRFVFHNAYPAVNV